MQQSVLNQNDVNYVNSLGWAAAWALCAFNGLGFFMIAADYIFDFVEFLQKRKKDLQNIDTSLTVLQDEWIQ